MSIQTFNRQDGRVRYGFQDAYGIPAFVLPHHLEMMSETVTPTHAPLTRDSLGQGGMASPPLKGNYTLAGDVVAVFNPEDAIPIFAVVQQWATATDLAPQPTGTHQIDMAPTETVDQQRFMTWEFERADGHPMLLFNVKINNVVGPVAEGSVNILTISIHGDDLTLWGDIEETVPSALGAGSLFVRGRPGKDKTAQIDRPGTTGDLYVEVVEQPSTGVFRMRSMLGGPRRLSVDVTTAAASLTVTADSPPVDFDFREELFASDFITIEGATLEVVTVAETTFDVDVQPPEPFVGVACMVTWGPAGPPLSTFEFLSGPSAEDRPRWSDVLESSTGLDVGDDHLRTQISSGFLKLHDAAEPVDVPVTGTVTVVISTRDMVGVGTSFLTDLPVGSHVEDGSTVGGFTVVAVADDLNAVLDIDHPTGIAGASITTWRQWKAVRNRPSWSRVLSAAAPFSEIASSIFVNGEKLEVDSLTITATPPIPATTKIGSAKPGKPLPSGKRIVTIAGPTLYDLQAEKMIHGLRLVESVVVQVIMKADPIAPTAPEINWRHRRHTWLFLAGKAIHVGGEPTVADGGRFTIDLNFVCHSDDAGNPDLLVTAITSVPATPVP